MNRLVRRLGSLALAGLLVLPTGCASRGGWHSAGWEAGMMGAMVVGGLILGRGIMHGRARAAPPDSAFSVERFQPARLLEQRALLELTDEQVAGLEVLRDEVAAQRQTPEEAAHAAYGLLTRLQRAAAASRAQDVQPHH